MKILLVDDHPIFLEGMKNLLLAGGAHEIETANGGTEALQKAADFQPDLILMDIMMKPVSGLDATRMIKKRFPSIKIVMLTASESEEHLFESVKCGACGYLLKNLEGGELFEMLSRFEEGEIPCSPGLAVQLLEEFRKNSDACAPDAEQGPIERGNVLTKRQEDILRLVAGGMKYRDVAEALSITERTVKYSMEQILDRLHMSNRQEAVVYAAQNGIVK
jgi:two-component system NarL family response regulator